MTVIAAILIFGILIFVHELGHFLTAKAFKIKVHEFSIGMGPALLKRRRGDTDYSLRLLPIGGFVRLEGEDNDSEDERAFCKRTPLQRMIVLIAGAFMNLVTGLLIFVIIFSFAATSPTPVIDRVADNSPAAAAGLLEGDRITSINGSAVHIYSDISFSLYLNGASSADIGVKRGNEKLNFNITPQNDGGRYIMGIVARSESPTIGNVLYNSFYNTIFVVKVVFVSLRELIFGRVSVSEMSGPVGIVGEIGEAAKYGILEVLNFAALIAVNLGVMNMLPLPALDGGRVFFILIELIRRKPIKPEIEGYIHTIGLILLLILMVVITYSDIAKLIV